MQSRLMFPDRLLGILHGRRLRQGFGGPVGAAVFADARLHGELSLMIAWMARFCGAMTLSFSG